MPLRGLTIVVAGDSPMRFREALVLAAAQAALGAPSQLFLQGAAVALMRQPVTCAADDANAAAGLPRLDELIDEALALGVRFVLCQTGLHLAAIDRATLDKRIDYSGPLEILRTLDDDRFIVI